MADKCENCTEKCPKAEFAHQAAMGRMYATNEFINLQKKIDSGELVEVVRCKNCLWFEVEPDDQLGICHCGHIATNHGGEIYPERNHFCSYGERRTE